MHSAVPTRRSKRSAAHAGDDEEDIPFDEPGDLDHTPLAILSAAMGAVQNQELRMWGKQKKMAARRGQLISVLPTEHELKKQMKKILERRKRMKKIPRPVHPKFNAMNRRFQRSITDPTATVRDLDQLVVFLGRSEKPYNAVTFNASLMVLAQRLPELALRTKLSVAIHILRRAQVHNVPLKSHVLRQILALATPLRKVNVVLVVQRLVQLNKSKPTLKRHLDQKSYFALVLHWGLCRRQALVDEVLDELLGVHATRDPTVFGKLMVFLLHHEGTDIAAHVWRLLRLPALSAGPKVDASMLRGGALLCAATNNATEAEKILRKYRELEMRPSSDTLHVLTSLFIRTGHFDLARELMRWIIRNGYVLGGTELHLYVQASERVKAEQRPKDNPLLRLGFVLAKAPSRLCASAEERQQFIRAYVRGMYQGVVSGRLEPSVDEVFECAERALLLIQRRDVLSLSHVVFFASRAERLDAAFRITRSCHVHAGSATSAPLRRALHAFAYDALLEQSFADDRVDEALALVFHPEGADPEVAAACVTSFMYSFGRRGRLDICSEMFAKYSRFYGCDAWVSSAYMSVLADASRPLEALSQFRALRETKKPLGAIVYDTLGTVLLKNMPSRSAGVSGGHSMLDVNLITEMACILEEYLIRTKNESEKDELIEMRGVGSSSRDSLVQPVVTTTKQHVRDMDPESNWRMDSVPSMDMIQEKVDAIRAQLALEPA
ncbi:hypothetical protein FVE85_2589 [Porphyridium purpureum]|uniref:Pentatricopeptide repeat-containing protein n=1 Tax=Porphyridium purpureum TaxID=35688 RepID=A0A5J4YLK5_PORPP|nr:hypothetical protein FVE85_2589 [Porphyridium purpureum]|eukprot:POR1701..scf291_13